MDANTYTIIGFHRHTVIKTIQQIKSRFKELTEDKQKVSQRFRSAMFHAGDIRRNVFLKFIKLCMETCLCPSEGHKYGGQKLTKRIYVIEFAIKIL